MRLKLGDREWRFVRFGMSGGTSAAINFGLLYLMVSVGGYWYLGSAAVATVVSDAINFVLQKTFTFRDRAWRRTHHQTFWFALLKCWNIGLELGALYVLVEYAQVWYFFAQMIIISCISMQNFLVYHLIFAK